MKRKAINSHIIGKGGLFDSRLFFLLKCHGLHILSWRKLKYNVAILQTTTGKKILKGYTKQKVLQRQIWLSYQLNMSGFIHFPVFETYPSNVWYIKDREVYWSIQSFIESKSLSYKNEKDRQEALILLQDFHDITKNLSLPSQLSFPHFSLVERWKARYEKFVSISTKLTPIFGNELIFEFIHWGKWVLDRLKDIDFEPTNIIHGDLASHNFLRTKQGKVYLIDFDLVSLGLPEFDYLQLCNRVLPFLHWNFEWLAKEQLLNPYLDEEWFLISLVYPLDLYREMNKFYKNPYTYSDHRWLKHATIQQFSKRFEFVQKIMNMVK